MLLDGVEVGDRQFGLLAVGDGERDCVARVLLVGKLAAPQPIQHLQVVIQGQAERDARLPHDHRVPRSLLEASA